MPVKDPLGILSSSQQNKSQQEENADPLGILKKKDGISEPGKESAKPSPTPSPSPEKPKSLEEQFPFLTEKIKINQPGDIMTGQQRQQMAASKIKSDKQQDYIDKVLPVKAKEAKKKVVDQSLHPEVGEQFNPIDFTLKDIVDYSGGKSLQPLLDQNAPQKDKFNSLNQFFGNDASNATSYFEHRIDDVDNQIKNIQQNPMLWRNLNQGKSDLQEINNLKDYKLKLAAAARKVATNYTAWLYPEASIEEKGNIVRKLSGDKSVYDEMAFKDKGLSLTDEQKFNNAKQGLDVERERLESDYVGIPIEQRDDVYFNRLAQLNDYDSKLINQFPEYKRSQMGMMIAQLASQDPKINVSSKLGLTGDNVAVKLFGGDLDKRTVDYLHSKYNIPKEDLKGITYGDIPDETLFGNIRKGLYNIGSELLGGATRIFGTAIGADADRITALNRNISGFGNYLYGDNPYEKTSHPQTIIDINPTSSTYLQSIPNPKAGKANYNLTTVSHAMATGAAQFAGFIGGLKLATKGVQAAEWALMKPLSVAAEQSAAMSSYMILSNYENNWQKANQVLGKDASEVGKGLYATAMGYIDKLAFDVLPKDKLFLGSEAKKELTKELTPVLKNLTIKNINREVLQTKIERAISGIVNTSKEVGHITAATSAAEIAKGIVNSMVGEKGKGEEYMREAFEGVKDNLINTPLSMALPLGLMEVSKMKQNSGLFKENVYNAGLEPNKYISLIQQELAKGNLTKEEANSRMEVVKTMHNIVQSTPDINPRTGEPLTHSQQVEYAYNRLKESALRAKALELVEDPGISSVYLEDAQKLADERKKMLEQPEVELPKQEEKVEEPTFTEVSEFIPSQDLKSTEDVMNKVNDEEYINQNELEKTRTTLYTALDKHPEAAHLIEPLIQKLESHAYTTETKTVETVEKQPIEGTLAAKRKIEIKPALEQSEGSQATVTLADGTEHSGKLAIRDGNYVIDVEGQEPVIVGEKAITDRDLKAPEGEQPVALDENGNVQSVTFETRDGHRVKIEDPEKALDLGIQLNIEALGEIPDEAFDKAYQDVVKTEQIEIPVEKPTEIIKAEEVTTEAKVEAPKKEIKNLLDAPVKPFSKAVDLLGDSRQPWMYEATLAEVEQAKNKETMRGAQFYPKKISDIESAIEQGKYEKAIEEGRMTAQDAKQIIESAGLKAPESINSLLELPKQKEAKVETPKEEKKPASKAAKFISKHITGEPEGAIPTQAHTVETIDKADTTGFNDVQKKNIEDLKRVLKSITKLVGKETGKELKAVIHSTRESAAKAAYDATIKGGGTEAEARANMQNQGNRGWWSSTDGTIHLNMAEVASETANHEGVHPILDAIAKVNPGVIDKFHAQLEALPQAKEIIEGAKTNYAEYDSQGKLTNSPTVKIEAITDYLAKVADGQIKLDKSNWEKIRDYVVNLLSKLGIATEKDIRSIDDLRKLAQTISEKFAKGEEVKLKDVSEIKPNQPFEPIKNNGELGDVNAAGKIDPKNISDAKVGNNNPLFSKETFKEVELSDLPVKSLKEKLDEFDNKAIAINSDPTRVGKVEMPSGKEIFLYGGARYSSIKSNVEGEIGFSSTNLGKPKQVRGAIEKLFPEKNGEGLILVTTQKPESMKGNAYSLEYTLDALSTLPKTILKSSEFKNEFFGKDIVAIKDAFGENKYNEFLKKYGRADFSNPEVFKNMTEDLLNNVGSNFIARNSLIDNMLAGIVAKDTRVATKGEPGYVSVDPKKYIAKELFNRLGLNQEKLFYELGEKGIVDAYMNDGKWGFVTNGFTSDSKIDHLSIQDRGVVHPQFNAKFHGKDPFFLDGAYMIDKLFLPEEMITKKGDVYVKKASLMVAGSMYPKGKVELAPKEVEKPFSELPKQKTKTYDTENKPGISGKVGVGEKPIEAKPVEGGGAQEISGGGVLQAPGAEGKGEKAPQFSKVKGTLDGKPATFIKHPEDVEVVNGFYSPIEKRLVETKADKLSANKWKEIVGKGDEAKYTGVLGYLESLPPTQQVSKSEIQKWMKDNRIEINEVVKKEGKKLEISKEEQLELGSYIKEHDLLGFDSMAEAKRAILDEKNWDKDFDIQDKRFIELGNKYRDSFNKFQEEKVKYKDYQLPGEKSNYKEVLITLPSKKGIKSKASEEMVAFRKEMDVKYGENARQKMSDTENKYLKYLIEESRKAGAFTEKEKFKSSHYDEPNILAHIRMNTRVDAEGNKVLHIEEFQSDWGQQGKKQGFGKKLDISIKESPNNRILTKDGKVLLNTFSDKEIKDWQIERAAKESGININELITDKSKSYYSEIDGKKTAGNFLTKEEAVANANDEAERIGKSNIPEAPFVTKTADWTKLAWKVALKEAVKEGADKITWTTGEQQNERYDLSKQVDAIQYAKSGEDKYLVSVTDKKGNEILYRTDMSLKEIDSYLGKDIAEKISKGVGDEQRSLQRSTSDLKSLPTLKGENLSVGGTGMKGFYGSPSEGKLGIVGEVAKSLFKQEPKTTEINGEQQNSIDITPEMKAQVEAGLPQFSKSKSEKVSDMKDIIKEYVDAGFNLSEIKEAMQDEFGKHYKDVESTIEQAHQELTTTGIKNEVVQRERAERGLEPIEAEAKRSFGDVFDNAKKMIADGDMNGLTLAAEVVKNPRPLKAEESAVLLIDRMRISREYDVKNNQLLEAQKNGEKDKADIIQSQLETLEEEMNLNDEAARKSGYEQGLGLAARRMLIAKDYSLATQMSRLKAANGGKEVPEQYKKQLEGLIKQLEEANKNLSKLETTSSAKEKQKELDKVKKSNEAPEQIKKEKISIKDKIVNKWGKIMAAVQGKAAQVLFSKVAGITPEKQAKLEAISKDVNDLVKVYAKEGNTNLRSIIDNIHSDISSAIPELTRQDIEDVVLGKYSKEVVKKPLTKEQIQAQANVRKVQTKIDLLKEELRLKQRDVLEKGVDYLHGWHRFSILSGIPSLGKIGTAALSRGIVTRAENVIGQALSKIPGVSKIAKKAAREGGFNPKAEAKAFTTWFDKMTKEDMREVMKTGMSSIDYLYGKKEPMAGKVPEWMEFFGRMHSAMKLLPKRAEFFRSLEMRTEHALKNGRDVNDPMVQQELATAAYNDALRSIFMQDNIVTETYTNAVKKLEKSNPALASALKFALPIVKVPTNYVAEASSYVPPIAGLKAISTLIRGRKGMTPEQADYFMRAMKKGSIGTAVVFLGFMNPQAIGGYYTGKRKKDDLEAGDIELFGVKLPHFMLHTPLLEMLQVGATMRRAYDAKIGKGEEANKFTEGIPDVFKGLSKQVPFIGTGERISKAVEDKGNAAKKYLSSLGASLIEPQLMQNLADWTDMQEGEVVKRKAETFGETLKEGIPGLRRTLKEDKSQYTSKEYEAFSKVTEKGINIPDINRKDAYRIKADEKHINGTMTPDEYDKFIPLVKKYSKENISQVYNNYSSDFAELKKMIDKKSELTKDKLKIKELKKQLQSKINSAHNQAVETAKKDLNLID